MIIFEELRFYDVITDKNYDIIFGSNTLANLEWGPEYSEGCNYNRIYTVVDEYTSKKYDNKMVIFLNIILVLSIILGLR